MNRLDVIIKVLYFQSLVGGVSEPEFCRDLYDWHIDQRNGHRFKVGIPTDNWKMNLDDYHASAKTLFGSMKQNGFDTSSPITLDKFDNILSGAHRLACAIALELEEIPVERNGLMEAWAPLWGPPWMEKHGLDEKSIDYLISIYEGLTG